MSGDESFEPGGTGVTAWTTGRIITKDLPTPDMVRLRMYVEDRVRHRPGQHYLIRLRAPDGYTAQRSYSLASDDSDALVVARTARELADFGIEPRHLRAFRTAADREVGLVEQVTAPVRGSRHPAASARAAETASEVAALTVRLHATLVKAGLSR